MKCMETSKENLYNAAGALYLIIGDDTQLQ